MQWAGGSIGNTLHRGSGRMLVLDVLPCNLILRQHRLFCDKAYGTCHVLRQREPKYLFTRLSANPSSRSSREVHGSCTGNVIGQMSDGQPCGGFASAPEGAHWISREQMSLRNPDIHSRRSITRRWLSSIIVGWRDSVPGFRTSMMKMHRRLIASSESRRNNRGTVSRRV